MIEEPVLYRIMRVAGTGAPGSGGGGDDGIATSARVPDPLGLAVTPDGGFLVSDTDTRTVRKVWPSGAISRVAGNGGLGAAGDDGPATNAQLGSPRGLAMTADGGFLIADEYTHTVRKVSASGVITRVAGTGVSGGAGDDGPATDAQLGSPVSVTVTPDGGFLVGDLVLHTVRKVSADGVITRVAGTTGVIGVEGDDGQATDATLGAPSDLAVTTDGGFLIVDFGQHVVRKVSAGGVITRVAGDGQEGRGGDDGPATDAQLDYPFGLALTSDGAFFLACYGSSTVRRVSPGGVITRVAGTGVQAGGGDDGLATEAALSSPTALAALPDGGVLVADYGNNMIRKLVPLVGAGGEETPWG